MEKEFLPYDRALKLKELGFDEPCFGIYTVSNKKLFIVTPSKDESFGYLNTPTYSQAFRWFRENYALDSFVNNVYKSTIKVGYYFGIDKYKGIEFRTDFDAWYNTHEEAELACLDKLIEIVEGRES